MDKKSNDSLLHLLVNDFEAAKEQINKSMGGIRIKPRNHTGAMMASGSRTLKQQTAAAQDQDVSVEDNNEND